ncbi:diguanylate cyclase domain-containing protein [Pseudooceanicola sp. LIPI14-2-Ac024]|uniref:GGDEF domain-containing protein n=1 Tax=Pseudooceanicola sp. LIPI14-2-Ac024 TaxID=3344875 RepID=UPI0035CE90A9
MTGPAAMAAALDVLCPMHVALDPTGHMRHVGPGLRKLRPEARMEGQRFLERFQPLHPRNLASMADLMATAGQKLRLRLRDQPRTVLSAVLMPWPGGGAVVNLGFGISIVDAVRDYTLTQADFAPTDLAVELLFLVEAKSAAMDSLRQMSMRFHGARVMAEEQALTDPVTGLGNRRALELAVDQMIGAGQEFALMHLDLDHFKQVNDTLGHAAGDHVLGEVARILRDETREGDSLARVGGDEFMLVFRALCDPAALAEVGRRIIARLQVPMAWQGQPCRVSASAGTAISTDYRQPQAGRMAADSDTALYAAKRGGRGRHLLHRDLAQPDDAA